MKRLSFFGLLILFVSSSVSLAEVIEGEYQKYVNVEAGFMVAPPALWQIKAQDSDPKNIIVEMVSADQQHTVTLNVIESAAALDDIVKEVESDTTRKIVEKVQASVPALKTDTGIIVETSFEYLDQPFVGLSLLFKKGDKVYKLEGWVPETDAEVLKGAVREIINDFYFIETLFYDDFKDKEKTSRQWGNETGGWFIDGGAYTSGTKVRNAFSLAGDASWDIYTLTAELKGGKNAGVLVHARDAKNGCLVLVDTKKDTLSVSLLENGKISAPLAQAALIGGNKSIIRLRVTAKGHQVVASVEGGAPLFAARQKFERGKIGLYLDTSNKNQYWDSVKVTTEN